MLKAATTFLLTAILAAPAGAPKARRSHRAFVFTLVTPEAEMTAREVTERLYKVKSRRTDGPVRDLTYLDFSTLDFKGASLARTVSMGPISPALTSKAPICHLRGSIAPS